MTATVPPYDDARQDDVPADDVVPDNDAGQSGLLIRRLAWGVAGVAGLAVIGYFASRAPLASSSSKAAAHMVVSRALPQGTQGDVAETLKRAKAQASAARAESARLAAASNAASNPQDKARLASAAVAARIQASEAEAQAGEARLALIAHAQAVQARVLATQQQPIVRLTGILQLLARKPAVAVFAQPGTVDDMVHARIILGAAIPEIERRTAGLRAQIARSRALQDEAQLALDALARSRTQLADERSALAKLEGARTAGARAQSIGSDPEAQQALALGERARDLVDLLGSIDADNAVRERLAALDGPVMRPGASPGAQDSLMPALPALATPAAKSGTSAIAYRLPVVGEIETGMGEVAQGGLRSRGITIRAASGAQIVAPASGRVAFAGPYQGYGQILIVEHPGGWTSLITNLIGLSAKVGQQLVAGEPVGRAGPDRPRVTVELRKDGTPQDIVALL